MLGQVGERTILSYIYNPNTEQENLNIMNEALKRVIERTKNSSAHTLHISAQQKNPLKIKGFYKRETAHEVQ
jgi:predicted N-acyltransferase